MFFFFKQKTAYEMRISDWSSDVCSSDLLPVGGACLGKRGIDRFVAEHVALAEQRTDVGGGLRAGFRIAIKDRDLDAGGAQRLHGRKAEARGAAGHDRSQR